ncbi:ATP-binding protein [Salinigranum marinum]|uniref:ATP-binding protein n=1 Tax=Salinigranum marinum TaxID=1515595 RepID=UPI002989AE79|nr:ATP-binding protein [Salinigranum marinum]
MEPEGVPRARVLLVGVDADVGADLDARGEFDVRRVETAAEARRVFGEWGSNADATTDQWPDCVASAAVLPDDEGLCLLRWVREHARDVATVLAPGPADGSERLASEAVAAGLTGYCLAGTPLDEAVETALGREWTPRTDDDSQRYRTLAENLPNGAVALYDREMRYLVVAGTVFEDLSLDPDDLEGERFEEAHSPAFVERYGPLYRAALDGDRSDFEFSYEGQVFRGHTVPVRDRTGAVVAGMALTQDVTADRERRARLERQNERLDRQNERLDRFAGIVSHDLRAPLNVVEGSVVLLRDAAEAGDTEAVDENVERVSRALARMADIVESLLTLARRPETVYDLDDVPFRDAVTEAWAPVAPPTATLSVDLGDRDGLVIRADRDALYRLFENLLSNAVEHGSTSSQRDADDAVEHGSTSPRSGTREDAAEHGASVHVEWFVDGDERGFAVADDGPGIPPADRDRVFDWGYTTDEEGGLGLGLCIVHEIAEAHGWTLSVTESAAGGARFEVRGVDTSATGDGAGVGDDGVDE